MVQFDNQYRQIKVKIVYYGPALGGKTTCLQSIHQTTDRERRTKLYSLNTATDRTLFFDLLSLDLGKIRGYRLALQLYTVPGQVQYNATRRAVLSGADGIVFVADSQESQREANVASFKNLHQNLAANGLDGETIPLVLMLNKRDLAPLLTPRQLNEDLNARGAPTFSSVATEGAGVMEGFRAICELTLGSVADKLGVGGSPVALARLRDQVHTALVPYVRDEEADRALEGGADATDDVAVTTPESDGAADEPLSDSALVGEAVRANMAMTDLNAQLDRMGRQLARSVRVLGGIAEFGATVAGEREPSAAVRLLATTAVRLLRTQGVAVLMVPGSGLLREAAIHGFERDPLLATADENGEPIALGLLEERRPRLIAVDQDGGGDLRLEAVRSAGLGSALAVPMVAQGRVLGMLTAYRGTDRPPLDEDDLQLATVLASSAGMGISSARAWQRLEGFSKGLEEQVSERTSELRASFDEVRRLNADLSEKNRLLETAHRELSELDRVKDELIARISHELKTPVTSLATAAKILERYRDAPVEKGARFVAIIRDEAAKLTEIIDSMFQASLLTAPVEPGERRWIEAGELFRGAIAPLRDLAAEREVHLQLLVPSGLDRVLCEPENTATALRAVVKNGIEFNHKGGEVALQVRRVSNDGAPWLMVTVRDTGVGIPEGELPHVTETFWQGGNVLTGEPRGVGLGLAIARRLVERQGGRLEIESELAEGTSVTLALPQS